MAAASVSVILHACVWPRGDAARGWRGWREWGGRGTGSPQVVEAREPEDAAVGAAALVNQAAGRAAGDLLVVAEPCVGWAPDALAAVLEAGSGALAVTAPVRGRPRLWAVPRDLFDALGRLDERLWSVGEIDDLAARASAAGHPVVEIGSDRAAGEWLGPESYPLCATTRAFFEIRNPLLSAFNLEPPTGLGRTLAAGALRALKAGSEASALDPRAFRFDAPRELRRRAWPADEAGTLIPLLALDSLLAEVAGGGRETFPNTPGAITDLSSGASGPQPVGASATAPPIRAALNSTHPVFLPHEPAPAERPGDDATLVPPAGRHHHPGPPMATNPAPGSGRPDAGRQASPTGSAVALGSGIGTQTAWLDEVERLLFGRSGDVEPEPRASRRADRSAEETADYNSVAKSVPSRNLSRPRRVAVIVVNWNGCQHLQACLGSILASDYPPDSLEVILVDNGSTDGSRDLVASAFPSVRLVALESNRGFTGGNNAGVAVATGEVLVFLNNDMRVEPGAIAALVRTLDPRHPAAAARVLSWDGRRIDFVRGTVNFEAFGFQEHYAEPYRPELASEPATFFPNGGAFAVTRAAYDRAGGFDDAYFAYYDDVDLGWRIRLAGGEIAVAHDAVVYHRHGATSRRFPDERKRFLMERNAIWTAIKCYGDETLPRALGPILLLAVRRVVDGTAVARGSAFARSLAPFSRACRRWPGRRRAVAARDVYDTSDLARAEDAAYARDAARGRDAEGESGYARRQRPGLVRRLPLASLAALGAALDGLPAMLAARHAVQRARTTDDREVLPLMGRALEYSASADSYKRAQDALARALELNAVFAGRPHLLIVTHEPLGGDLAGPGIRALEIGRALAGPLRVTVAAPGEPALRDARCAVAPYSFEDARPLKRLAESADVILLQGFTLARFPFIGQLDAPVVADLYCPFTLEHLEQETAAARRRPPAADDKAAALALSAQAADILRVQNAQLAAVDFFICASERQRDFWLGALHTAGRINPLTYAADPTLRALIDVVPFGLPDEPFDDAVTRVRAAAGRPGIKGRVAGIGPDDRVVYWGGSMLDWQDPQSLVKAIGALARHRHDITLVFAGTRHPNPQVKPMAAVDECRALAASLGLTDRHVFFNDWVPYDERAAWLADADVGVSTHRDHLETRFAFRTRMLDYIWAAIPIVCTTGDHFARLVEDRRLGLTVPPGDAAALAGAIARLIDDRDLAASCRANLRTLAAELRWSQVVDPLRRFAARPAFAADRAGAVGAYRARLEASFGMTRRLKRLALAAGISEARIERVKRAGVVQALMAARNRLAVARARRRSGRS